MSNFTERCVYPDQALCHDEQHGEDDDTPCIVERDDAKHRVNEGPRASLFLTTSTVAAGAVAVEKGHSVVTC